MPVWGLAAFAAGPTPGNLSREDSPQIRNTRSWRLGGAGKGGLRSPGVDGPPFCLFRPRKGTSVHRCAVGISKAGRVVTLVFG